MNNKNFLSIAISMFIVLCLAYSVSANPSCVGATQNYTCGQTVMSSCTLNGDLNTTLGSNQELGPILEATEPWEGNTLDRTTALFDESDPTIIHLWYMGIYGIGYAMSSTVAHYPMEAYYNSTIHDWGNNISGLNVSINATLLNGTSYQLQYRSSSISSGDVSTKNWTTYVSGSITQSRYSQFRFKLRTLNPSLSAKIINISFANGTKNWTTNGTDWNSGTYNGTAFDGANLTAAKNQDPYHFTKYWNNPVINTSNIGGNRTNFAPGGIIKDGGLYKQWFNAVTQQGWQLGYATSPDGINWTDGNNNLSINFFGDGNIGETVDPTVIKDADGYNIWLGSTRFSALLYMVSPDGITNWSTPIPVYTHSDVAISVVKIDSVYHYYFEQYDGRNWAVWHGTSNTKNGTIQNTAPLITKSDIPMDWRFAGAATPWMIYDGTKVLGFIKGFYKSDSRFPGPDYEEGLIIDVNNFISDPTTCLKIGADNVTIDCNNHSINEILGQSDSYGIVSGRKNTTIQNCQFNSFYNGIVFDNASNGIIKNDNVWGLNCGITLIQSSNNTITNSKVSSDDSTAILIGDSSTNNNTIYNNTLVSNTGTIVYLQDSLFNLFYLNNFTNTSGLYIDDENGNNFYNFTVDGKNQGNIYANVIDGSVNISGTSSSSISGLYIGNNGSGYPYNETTSNEKIIGATDYAPLTNQGPASFGCGNLASPNTIYNLTTDLFISGSTCFMISAANITLDCNGYTITGNNASSTYGVYSDQFNTTVKNCHINNFVAGIYFINASHGTIFNNTVNISSDNIVEISDADNNYPIYAPGIMLINDSNYNNILNNNVISINGDGIATFASRYNSIINSSAVSWHEALAFISEETNNSFNNVIINSNGTSTNRFAILIWRSHNTEINDSIGRSDTFNAIFITNDEENITMKNSKGISDSGLGIYVYDNVNNVLIINSTGISNSSYGFGVSDDITNIVSIINCTGESTSLNGMLFVAYNSNLTGGKATNLNNNTAGLSLSGNNIVLSNINASGNSGMEFNGGNYNLIRNVEAHGTNGYGIYFSDTNNTLRDSILSSDTNTPLYVLGSIDSKIFNNTLISTLKDQNLMTVDISSYNNIFYWNNFTATSGLYVNDTNGSNFYNFTVDGKNQGNIYANVINRSVNIAGTVSSSISGLYIGTTGNGYPYNNVTSGGKMPGATDYAPLTPFAITSPTINISSPIIPAIVNPTANLELDNITLLPSNPASSKSVRVSLIDLTNDSVADDRIQLTDTNTSVVYSSLMYNYGILTSTTITINGISYTLTSNDTSHVKIALTTAPNYQYNTSSINLNYIVSPTLFNISDCWYSVDGAANVTLSNCTNTTFATTNGTHTITVYANDTTNLIGKAERNFSVDLLTSPTISIASPFSQLYNTTNITLSYMPIKTLRNIDSCWYTINSGNMTVLANCANTTIPGVHGVNMLTVYANDSLGNIGSATKQFTVDTTLNINATTSNSSNITIIENITTLVVPANASIENIIIPTNISSNITVMIYFLNITRTVNQSSIILTDALNITRGNYSALFPDNITITGPANWTGEITLPTVMLTSSVTPTADSGYSLTSTDSVIEIGSVVGLTFDKTVRITLPGMKGKTAGYSINGVFTKITTTCTQDTQTWADTNIVSGGECVTNNSNDMLIWTKHFTTFVAYTQKANTIIPTGGSSGGGGGSYNPTATLSYTFNCTTGILDVIAKSSATPINNLEIILYNNNNTIINTVNTSNTGEAFFTIATNGLYNIKTGQSYVYSTTKIENMTLNLCTTTGPQVTNNNTTESTNTDNKTTSSTETTDNQNSETNNQTTQNNKSLDPIKAVATIIIVLVLIVVIILVYSNKKKK